MSKFREEFLEFYPPSESEIEQLLLEGMICVDANVLLDLYRFNPDSRAQLMKVLRKFGDRLWIPHQVALEFHRNRINAIAGFEKKYSDARSALDKTSDFYEEHAVAVLKELGKTTALPQVEIDALMAGLRKSFKSAKIKIDSLQKNHGISLKNWRKDPVIDELLDVIGSKVGGGFDEQRGEECKSEAERRVKSRIPPGYKDANKDSPSGDYYVWRQILDEAKARNSNFLFVTRDQKEDWFRIDKNKTVSARPELIREASKDAGVKCAILSTGSFLHHANRVFRLTVSEEEIRQMSESSKIGRGYSRRAHDLGSDISFLLRKKERSSNDLVVLEATLQDNYSQLQDLESERSRGNFNVADRMEEDRIRRDIDKLVGARERMNMRLRSLNNEIERARSLQIVRGGTLNYDSRMRPDYGEDQMTINLEGGIE